jgi:hypothetical protein
MIWPVWQQPHWATFSSREAACSRRSPQCKRPSMLATLRPLATVTGVWQASAGAPSRCTVQAPHWAMPQPNQVPVKPSSSPRYRSSGISVSPSKRRSVPFMSGAVVMPIPLFGRGRPRRMRSQWKCRDSESGPKVPVPEAIGQTRARLAKPFPRHLSEAAVFCAALLQDGRTMGVGARIRVNGIAKLTASGWNGLAEPSWYDDVRAPHLPRLSLPSRDHQPRGLALL